MTAYNSSNDEKSPLSIEPTTLEVKGEWFNHFALEEKFLSNIWKEAYFATKERFLFVMYRILQYFGVHWEGVG